MSDRPKRLDTSGPPTSLTSNPFASLGTVPHEQLAEAPPRTEAPSQPKFRIERTRKGGYPIAVERRSAGKTVTIVRNVSGDTDALLSLLKKHCAAGGKAYEDSVEVQGNHLAKVEALLRQEGH